jgi:hypothetical protein
MDRLECWKPFSVEIALKSRRNECIPESLIERSHQRESHQLAAGSVATCRQVLSNYVHVHPTSKARVRKDGSVEIAIMSSLQFSRILVIFKPMIRLLSPQPSSLKKRSTNAFRLFWLSLSGEIRSNSMHCFPLKTVLFLSTGSIRDSIAVERVCPILRS